MSAPRLAYLCSDPGIPPDGVKGASVHFRELGRALRQEGIDVDCFLARQPRDQALAGPSTVVPPGSEAGPGGEVRLLAASAAMLDALAARGPHAAVYERLSLFGLAGLAYARQRQIPLAVEVNAPLWEEAARYRTLHLAQGARGLVLDVLRGADCVLAVSRALAARLEREGVSSGRIAIAPNGVNLAAFDAAGPAERPVLLRSKPVLAFVGSLKPWHGVPLLLAAFERLRVRRRLGLWVVGDGPLRDEVLATAARFPRDVVVEGAVPHERIAAILKAADVAVAPYGADSPAYFSPLKVVEALAAGCPLVAAGIAGVRELVQDGVTALLHDPGDVVGLTTRLERALDDAPLRAALVQAGRARARAHHDWRQRAREVAGALGLVPAAAAEAAS